MLDFSCQLYDLLKTNRSVYLKTFPDIPDFTSTLPFRIIIWGLNSKVELDVDSKNIQSVIALFDHTIFDKTQVDRLYVWNLKSLATYFHFHTQKFFYPQTSVIDLRVIENFLAIRKNVPENLIEAVNRTRPVVQYKGWQSLYKQIYLPLTLKVLPSIETTPVLNTALKRPEYPYYEIEGQINGRMNCYNKFSKGYLPHTMGSDIRKVLKPRGEGFRFLCSDFRHCEVSVLQWLSDDPKLKEILDSGLDLHSRIYEVITESQCDTETKRNFSKKMFLPIMYGCGPKGLAENLNVAENIGSSLIQRVRFHFPAAWAWMQERQELAKRGEIQDYFGRPRTFPENQTYLARNFSVQGVAATVCLEKLVRLHDSLNEDAQLAFSIHDGYGIITTITSAKKTYKIVKEICESESQLCSGLKMKVEIKFGANLEDMKVLWKD